MALVPGYVNGEPAEIPDNFARLWPDVYQVAEPAADTKTDESDPTASADKSEQTSGDAPRPRDRKDT
jgi:hypothetical protein